MNKETGKSEGLTQLMVDLMESNEGTVNVWRHRAHSISQKTAESLNKLRKPLLLRMTIDDSISGQLISAARSNDVVSATQILAENPSFDIDTPLTKTGNSLCGIAAYHGHAEFVDLAISMGASVRYRNNIAIVFCSLDQGILRL